MSSRLNPAMADGGRAFTDWNSSGQAELVLQMRLGMKSETAYRAYLQKHGDEIARETRRVYVTPVIPPRIIN